MQNIVLDTNVIVSSFISPKGLPAKVLGIVLSDEMTSICYNEKILEEYAEVLTREKFEKYNFDKNRIIEIISDIAELGVLINPVTSSVSMPDEKDRIFYDTAKDGNAILVTGNKKHYPEEPFIVDPAEYIKYLQSRGITQ